jgi:hypothetical protein
LTRPQPLWFYRDVIASASIYRSVPRAECLKTLQTRHNGQTGQVVLLPVGVLLPLAGSARVLDA